MSDLESMWPRHMWWCVILRARTTRDPELLAAVEAMIAWYGDQLAEADEAALWDEMVVPDRDVVTVTPSAVFL